jgi:hypothetical protein
MARKNAKRKVKIEQSPVWLLRFLAFGEIPEPKQEGVLECFMLRGDRRNEKRMWKKYRDFILTDWIQNRPGSRPWAWWRFDAPRWQKSFNGAFFEGVLPEPRKQVSGDGVIEYEKYPAIVPRFKFGVPCDWYEVDNDDPPMFEAESTYLQRHGLMSKSEEKRLSDKDFEPGSCLEYIKTYEK